MTFKTISHTDSARLSATSLDYEWDTTIGNGFLAANDEEHPRLAEALEALNIHGAADVAIGAAEWIVTRVKSNMDSQDGQLRLQAAWAATVDPRYSTLANSPVQDVGPDNVWTLPEWWVRRRWRAFGSYLEAGRSSKMRQVALGMILTAEHLCGRDAAFGPWLTAAFKTKMASSPRRSDDVDFTSTDHTPPTPQELTHPSREDRLAGLDPATNPYLRSAADMAALGFVGDPYPLSP